MFQKTSTFLRINYSLFFIILAQMDHVIIMGSTKTTAELADEIIDSNPRSYAYVTFLAGDGDYVKGVVCLAKGLRKVKAAYPLIVTVLPDVPEEHRNLLLNQGCLVHEIDPVLPPVSDKESSFAREYFAVNYCKLRLWKVRPFHLMVPFSFLLIFWYGDYHQSPSFCLNFIY